MPSSDVHPSQYWSLPVGMASASFLFVERKTRRSLGKDVLVFVIHIRLAQRQNSGKGEGGIGGRDEQPLV